jgi:hypothetical protein
MSCDILCMMRRCMAGLCLSAGTIGSRASCANLVPDLNTSTLIITAARAAKCLFLFLFLSFSLRQMYVVTGVGLETHAL